jgi:hypothetical protein
MADAYGMAWWLRFEWELDERERSKGGVARQNTFQVHTHTR